MSDLDPDRLMVGCHWQDCDEPATEASSTFCAVHYPVVFDVVSRDAQLIIERLRLEQRWGQWVYFIRRDDETTKIGYTAQPGRRMEDHHRAGMDTSSAVLVRGSREVEADIHSIFAHLATREPEVFTTDPAIWHLAWDLDAAKGSLWSSEQVIARYRRTVIPAPT